MSGRRRGAWALLALAACADGAVSSLCRSSAVLRNRGARIAATATAPKGTAATAQKTAGAGARGYSAEDITVLEGLEPVRKRPGMYIGSTGPAGLHHLVYEVVDNSVDEALAGHCTVIRVFLEPDGSVVVEDDGRGIPCGTHAKTGRSALETVMTVLHAGGKFGDTGYSVSGGLHGVGVSVVNALSERCSVEVRRDGFEHRMTFSRGMPTSALERSPLVVSAPAPAPAANTGGGSSASASAGNGGPGTKPGAEMLGGWRQRSSGTRVRFLADASIFKGGVAYDAETLARRFDQLAYLNAGLLIELVDLRPKDVRARASARTRADADIGDGADEDAARAEEGEAGADETSGASTPGVAGAAVEASSWERAGAGAAADAVGAGMPAGARFWRFEHAGGIEEMVADLSSGKRGALALAGGMLAEAVAGGSAAAGTTAAAAATAAGASGKGGKRGADASADAPPLLLSPAPIMIRGERRGVQIEIALQWAQSSYSERLLAFANGIHTPAGGSHVDGLKVALTRVVNAALKRAAAGGAGGATVSKGAASSAGRGSAAAAAAGGAGASALAAPKIKGAKDMGGSLSGEYIREGLTAVIAVKLANPEFEGQTKSKLGSSEVRSAVDSLVCEQLATFFDFNPKVLSAVAAKAIAAARAAEAAKAARDLLRSKSVMHRTVLPGKLSDCQSDDPRNSEIFIVEGDSAGGSAKQGRDRRTQAVLPLRGKILNIEKVDEKRIYQNTEVQALVTSLGLGVRGEELATSALRYHRVIVMTDADVDGAHIRTLLLTFFYRYAPGLLHGGFVYVACPPLYKVVIGQTTHYATSDEEAAALLAKSPKATLQRFKGLGEMMPEELWRTTMDPKRRMLKQVSVVDAARADSVFTTLMGENVAPRKAFIESCAQNLEPDQIDY